MRLQHHIIPNKWTNENKQRAYDISRVRNETQYVYEMKFIINLSEIQFLKEPLEQKNLFEGFNL